jgi:hypothetical protein
MQTCRPPFCSEVQGVRFSGKLASAARRRWPGDQCISACASVLLVAQDLLQRDWQPWPVAPGVQSVEAYLHAFAPVGPCARPISRSLRFFRRRSAPSLSLTLIVLRPSFHLRVPPPRLQPTRRCRCRCHRSLATHSSRCCLLLLHSIVVAVAVAVAATPSSRAGFLVGALHAHDSLHVSASTRPRPPGIGLLSSIVHTAAPASRRSNASQPGLPSEDIFRCDRRHHHTPLRPHHEEDRLADLLQQLLRRRPLRHGPGRCERGRRRQSRR